MKYQVEKAHKGASTPRWARRLVAWLVERSPRGAARPLYRFGLSAVLAAMLAGGNAGAVDAPRVVSNSHQTHGGRATYTWLEETTETWYYVPIVTVYTGESYNLSNQKYTSWEKWSVNTGTHGVEEGYIKADQIGTKTALVRDSVRLVYNYGSMSNLTTIRSGLWNYGSFSTVTLTANGVFINGGSANITTKLINGVSTDNSGTLKVVDLDNRKQLINSGTLTVTGTLTNRYDASYKATVKNSGKATIATLNNLGTFTNTGTATITTLKNPASTTAATPYTGKIDNSGTLTFTTYSGAGNITNREGAKIILAAAGGMTFTIGGYTGSYSSSDNSINFTDAGGTDYTGEVEDGGNFAASHSITEDLSGEAEGVMSLKHITLAIGDTSYQGVIQTNGDVTLVPDGGGENINAVYNATTDTLTGTTPSGCQFDAVLNTQTPSFQVSDAGGGEINGFIDGTSLTATIGDKVITGTYNADDGTITASDGTTNYTGTLNATTGAMTLTGGGKNYAGSIGTTAAFTDVAIVAETVTGHIAGTNVTIDGEGGGTGAMAVSNTTFSGVTSNSGTIQAKNDGTRLIVGGTLTSGVGGSIQTDFVTINNNTTFNLNADFSNSQTTVIDTMGTTIGSNVTLNITGWKKGDQDTQTVIYAKNGITGKFATVKVGGVVQNNAELTLQTFMQNIGISTLEDNTRIVVTNPNGLVWNSTVTDKATGIVQAHGHFYIEDEFTLYDDLKDNLDCAGGRGFMGWDGKTLTKTGDGKLTLAGDNTYTGETHVQAGILSINGDARIAGTSKLVLDGGYLNPTGDLLTTNVNLGDNGGGFYIDSNVAYGGQIIGGSNLVITGSNNEKKLTLLNTATSHTGDTIVRSGMVSISADGALSRGALILDGGAVELTGSLHKKNVTLTANGGEISAPGETELAGTISGPGPLAKKGAGTLTLTGNALNTGDVTVKQGKLVFGKDYNLAANNTSLVTEAGGTAAMGGNVKVKDIDSAGDLEVLDGTSLQATGNVALRATSLTSVGIAADPGKALLTANGDVDISAGASLDVTSVRAEQDATVIAANAVNGTFTNFSVDGVDQTGALTIHDFRTRAALDYSEAGKVKYIAPDGLVWDGTAVDGDAIQAHGHFIIRDGATASVGNDIADNAVVAANYDLADLDPAKKGTIGSDEVGLWDGKTLTKKGEGTLVLNGTNTYTGGTHIMAGTVAAAHDRNLGTGAVTLDGATAALSLTGAAGTIYAKDLVVTDNGGTIKNANDVTYSGHIQAADDGTPDLVGDLWKRGAGVLTIANIDPDVRNHLYVAEGTAVLAQAGLNLGLLHVTPTGAAIIAADTHDDLINDGNLTINSGITLTATNAILNPGSVINVRRNGLLRVEDAANPDNGNLTINGGTLNVVDPVNAPGVQTPLISWTGEYVNNVGPTIFDAITVNGMANGGITRDVWRNQADVSEDLENKRIVYTAAGLVWNNTATANPGLAAHGYFNVGNENVRLEDDLADNHDVDHAIAIDDWDGQSLTKRGAGSLILAGHNTYTGDTTVDAGRLQLDTAFASHGDITLSGQTAVYAVNANVNNAGRFLNANGGTLELMAGGVFTQAGNMATGNVHFEGGRLRVAGQVNMSGDWRLNLKKYKWQGQGGAAKGANAIITAGSVQYAGGAITVVGGTTGKTYEVIKTTNRTENLQLAAALKSATGSIFDYKFDGSDPYLYTLTILAKRGNSGNGLADLTPGSGLGGALEQIAADPDAAARIQDILDVLNGLHGDELTRALAELDNRNMNAATTMAMAQSINVQLSGLGDVMTDSLISDIAMEIAGEYDGYGNQDEEDDGRFKQRRRRRKGESAAAGGRPVYGGSIVMSNIPGYASTARATRAATPATIDEESDAGMVAVASYTAQRPIEAAPAVSTGYVYQDGTPMVPCDQDPNCGGSVVVAETAAPRTIAEPVASEPAPAATPAAKRRMKAAFHKIMRESDEDRSMDHRWSCDRSFQYKGFVKALGGWGDQDQIGEVAGFANNYAGVLAGVYRQFGRELRLGGVIGYTHMDMYLHDRFGEANDNAIRVSALGQYRWDRLFVNTAPGVGVHMIDSHRRLETFGRTARNQRTGFDFAWLNQIGYVFNLGKTLLTPTFSVTPIMMASPAYTEDGAGTANLVAKDCTNWSIVQTLDLRVSRAFRVGRLTILPEFRAGWEHRYLDNENTRQAFAVLPGYDWSAETETGARDKAVLGLSVTAVVNDRLDFNARWEQKIWAEGYQTNMNAGAALKF